MSSHTLKLACILFIATSLRFYRLDGHSLWSDEGNSVALIHHSFAEIAQRTAFDIHPPLYYWMLKLWHIPFGQSEVALRGLSAVISVLVVYLTYRLGRDFFSPRLGLVAGFLLAVNPFQLYYAQEARMYMLLTLWSVLTVDVGLRWAKSVHGGSSTPLNLPCKGLLSSTENGSLTSDCPPPSPLSVGGGATKSPLWGDLGGQGYGTKLELNGEGVEHRTPQLWLSLAYVLVVTAGLYTHYAYPVILAVLVPAAWWQTRGQTRWMWTALQLLPALAYLPWLPTAWRQVTTWPSSGSSLELSDIVQTVSNTLMFGLAWPYETDYLAMVILGVTIAVSMIGAIRASLRESVGDSWRFSHWMVIGWAIAPILLTLAVFSPSFLKFLLVSSPAMALLMAMVLVGWLRPDRFWKPVRSVASSALLITLIGLSLLGNYHYYHNDAFTRDDYRGIVEFITAMSQPTDGIILNAEGQQDVFNYYYQQKPPIYPLPRERPLDETATLTELHQIEAKHRKVYAVYWATEQADPQRLIESWLDQTLFKATDQWYGNVRLVSYATLNTNLPMTPTGHTLGDNIQLSGYGLPAGRFIAGDIVQLALRWQTDQPLSNEYVVFAQLLDANRNVVGQRDASPRLPTTDWPADQPISDTHGIFIEPGTPPGPHQLIVGLYDRHTGQRLSTESGTEIPLTTLTLRQPASPLPATAFRPQLKTEQTHGPVRLLGVDLYKAGHRSQPELALRAGEPLMVVAYWQKRSSASFPSTVELSIVDSRGEVVQSGWTQPLAGVDYPFTEWQTGEVVRAQSVLFLGGIAAGRYQIRWQFADGGWVQAGWFGMAGD